MVPGNDFRFTLCHVKRRAVGFGNGGNQIDDEDGEERQPVPREYRTTGNTFGLSGNDVGEVHAARHHHDAHQRGTHGNLVGNALCGSTHCAQERIFGVGSPARDDHAVNRQRGNHQDVQKADIDIGQHPFFVERNHRPRRKRRCKRHNRADIEQGFV